jgi:hypothetical protein
METDSEGKPEFIDLAKVDGAFSFDEGFSRPNWRLISEEIKKTELLDANAAWDEAVRQWMFQLQSDLGGDYQFSESRRFFILAPLSTETRTKIIDFSEAVILQIRDRLSDAAWKPKHGKHVILLFAEDDDYYQYVSYFYPAGNHPQSGGCLIHKDYIHIAAPYEPWSIRRTLAHELTHNLVVHLRLPLWLNEGLAKFFEHCVAPSRGPMLDHEIRERHLAFWNEQNIQEFWAGVSWRIPGDSNQLSYSLAEIFLNLLFEGRANWGAFLKQAQSGDAGQTAALECFGIDLGQIAATFLGPGDWRPRRKAMVAAWEARKKALEDDQEEKRDE